MFSIPLNRPSSPVLMTSLLLILHGSGCQSLVDAGDHGGGSSGGRISDMLFPDVVTESGLVSEGFVTATTSTEILEKPGIKLLLMNLIQVKLHGIIAVTKTVPFADLTNNSSQVCRVLDQIFCFPRRNLMFTLHMNQSFGLDVKDLGTVSTLK